jgi:type IV secretory pathway VirB10-like protein
MKLPALYLRFTLLPALLRPAASLPYLAGHSSATTANAVHAAAATTERDAEKPVADRSPWKATAIGTAVLAGAGGVYAWWRDRRRAADAETASKELERSAKRIVELEGREADLLWQIQQLAERGKRVPELERALAELEQQRQALEATVKAQQEQVTAAETLAGLRYRSFELVRGGILPASLAADEDMMRCMGAKIYGAKVRVGG